MESMECLEECLWSPGLQTSPKVHFWSVNEYKKRNADFGREGSLRIKFGIILVRLNLLSPRAQSVWDLGGRGGGGLSWRSLAGSRFLHKIR